MLAEIISIGDELTSGQRLDTNSQWLSERLGELGIRVLYHTTVADDVEANIKVFQTAFERADVVVATGGLGPTADDLTREAVAAATGTELILDEAVLDHIKAIFAFFKREMPERNRVQALFPAGSRPIPNPNGTAPGIDMTIPRSSGGTCRLFALPGVPAEMHQMWRDTLEPALAGDGESQSVIRHKRIKCFGIGESHMEERLPDLIRRGREPTVGITVSDATITLRITAKGATPETCYESMEPTIATIHDCLGELVYGTEDDELEHAVTRLLREQDRKLATVEWGTGGLVSHWMNDVPDVAGHYAGGLIIRDAQSASSILGIGAEVLSEHPPHSGEVAEAMAAACRKSIGADLALAVSDLPPFDRTADESPRVFFALANGDEVIVRSARYVGHPAILKTRAAKQALNLVRLTLLRAQAQ